MDTRLTRAALVGVVLAVGALASGFSVMALTDGFEDSVVLAVVVASLVVAGGLLVIAAAVAEAARRVTSPVALHDPVRDQAVSER